MSGGSWKAAESRIGTWFGAKGIGRSGRVPLSGGNSGSTRSDSPHSTIFIETKRDKSYHSVIRHWRSFKSKDLYVTMLPEVEHGKVISKSSDIWCVYSNDFELVVEQLLNNNNNIKAYEWNGQGPSALSLYKSAISASNSTVMDRKKEVVVCSLVFHGHPGFWIIINKNDIIKCWDLILKERKFREEAIIEEAIIKEEIRKEMENQ